MRQVHIAPSSPRRPSGRLALLATGFLAVCVCAPVSAFAQTAPVAAEPHYRGIVTVPPSGGSAQAPPAATTPAPSSPLAAGAQPASPAVPETSAGAGAPPGWSTPPAVTTPPSVPPAAGAQPAPRAAPDVVARAGDSTAPAAPNGTVTGRPIIRDTATLVIDGRAILLAGIEGVEGAPRNSFRDLVEEAGGIVTCVPAAGRRYTYTCLLPDGRDLAMIALVNGADHIGLDAPDSYRKQEADARINRRGVWTTHHEPGQHLACSGSSRSPSPPRASTPAPQVFAFRSNPPQVFDYQTNPR